MGKLTDDLKQELAPRDICKLCRVLEVLDPEDAAYVREVLRHGAPHNTLARVLTRNGHKIGADSIRRHLEKGHK